MENTLKSNYRSLKKADDFYRAEIKLNRNDFFYLVKLKKLNGKEACFFIKQDSIIFNKIKTGKVLKMKCWTSGATKIVKSINGKVTNIEKRNQELLNGHYLVHISIPCSDN
jgi:hypothetical protein